MFLLVSAAAQTQTDINALHRQALELARSGNQSAAIKILKQILSQEPASAGAWNDLGVLQRKEGLLSEAEASFQKALEYRPHYENAMFNLASAFEKEHRLADAAAIADELVTQSPNSARLRLLKGRLLLEMDDNGDADVELSRALELDSALTEARVLQGTELYRRGLVSQAITELQDVTKTNSDSADAFFELGLCFSAMGRPKDAEDAFRRELQIDSESKEGHLNLGQLLEAEGSIEQASVEYRAAARLAPDDPTVVAHLAAILDLQQQSEEAIHLLSEAVQRHPRDAHLRLLFGIELERRNDVRGALRQMETAIQIDPNWPDAHAEAARLFGRLGEKNDERDQLEIAARENPESSTLAYQLGNVLKQQGNPIAAESQFKRSKLLKREEVQRDEALGHLRSGVLLAEREQPMEAVSEFKKAVSIAPTLSEAYFDMGGVFEQLNDLPECITNFQKALQLAPHWAEAHYQLGQVLYKVGHVPEARLNFEAALKDDPNYQAAKHALRTLP